MDKTKLDIKKYSSIWEHKIQADGLREGRRSSIISNYTSEEIQKIISDGDQNNMRLLSTEFYKTNGMYRNVIDYYANLILFNHLLSPKIKGNTNLQNKDGYYDAIKFVDGLNLTVLGPRIVKQVLKIGVYYGLVQNYSKKNFSLIDLPVRYCRVRFTTNSGVPIVEFNVNYFNDFNEIEREELLGVYPKLITDFYRNKNRVDSWIVLPPHLAMAIQTNNGTPTLLHLVPAIMQYDDGITLEIEKYESDIKKILSIEMPVLNTGELPFEPDEVAAMQKGMSQAIKRDNDKISVLSTYGKADVHNTSISDAGGKDFTKHLMDNVYSQAGASGQLFTATNSATLKISIQQDISKMMEIVKQIQLFFETTINNLYASKNCGFGFYILPTSYFTMSDYYDMSLKAAMSGYSYLLPFVSLGFSQSELVGLKEVENDLLDLKSMLVPLNSGYNTSGEESNANGRPQVDDDEKSEKTIQNIGGGK